MAANFARTFLLSWLSAGAFPVEIAATTNASSAQFNFLARHL